MPTITVGQSLTGDVTTAYELLNYDVALTANSTYTIRVVGAGTSSFTLGDPLIDGIYNSTGSTYINGFNNDGLISGPNGRDAMTTFRPATNATYRIMVSGDLGTTGTFQISVTNSNGGTDNVAATTATTGAVSVGGSVTGTIDTDTDVDWYRVPLTGGTTYTVRMRGLASNNGTLPDPVIAGVYDSSGRYIVNTYVDDLDTRDAGLTFVAPSTGNFYIAADGWSTYTGTFSLDVNASTTDVPGNTTTGATLAIGSSVTTKMEQPYDHDWFAVSLTAGVTYQFSLNGTGTDNTPVIHGIFDAAGNYTGAYAAPILGPWTASSTTIFTPTASGTYYIDAFALYEGTYTLSAAQIENDVPTSTSTAAAVAVNGSATGNIGGATDVDWYRVNLVSGMTYVIKMQGSQSGAGTLEDPLIAGIFDAAGARVANTFSDDNDGNEASLVFRPTATGTYYIAADGYAGYTGSYRLSVTEVPGDIGQAIATASTVTLNNPAVVTIDDAADVDWYSVSLTAGSTYGIRLQGAPTKRGTLYDPVITGVYDSVGQFVTDTFVDDSRGLLNPVLSFTPSTSGTYYISADGYDRFTGTAKLAVTIDNIGTTNGTAGSFTVGTPADGTIDGNGDIDHYGVNLEASTTYYVRMLGIDSRSGDLADPLITAVYNSGGTSQTLTTINDPTDPLSVVVGRDSWVKFTTAAGGAGTYYVAASGAGGTDGTFMLSADKDIAGSQTTTATIPVPGSVTGMIDESTDTDWYAVTLNTNTSYVVKMLGVYSGAGSLADPYINGIRLSTTPTTIVAGTSGTGVDNALGRDSVARIIPATAGTYYINAQSSSSTFGSYVLSIATEVGNTIATSDSTLTIGGFTNGTIDDTTDSDYFKISLTANTSYLFKMLGVETGVGTLDDPLISSIRNSSNTAVTGLVTSSVGLDSYARWIPTASGDYYVEAQGAGTDAGTFRLTAEAEIGNTAASAGSITVGGSVASSIDDGTDSDYFKFSHTGNTGYLIRMKGTSSGSGTLPDPNIAGILTSSAAATTGEVFLSDGTDSIVLWAPTSATAADYIIDAQGTGTKGTYTLSIETEAGNTVAGAWSLPIGGSATGTIDVGSDNDYYKVALLSTSSYVFKMVGVDGGGGTLLDPTISGLFNSTGTSGTAVTGEVISASGRDAIVRYAPTANGDYFVDAQGSGGTGTFTLYAESEAGSANTNAQALSLGTTINAAIDDGSDTDRYVVTLATSTRYRISMLGDDGGNGTLTDSLVSIRSASAQLAAQEGSAGASDAVLIYTTPSTGTTYYIDADNGASNPTIVGTYKLLIELWP